MRQGPRGPRRVLEAHRSDAARRPSRPAANDARKAPDRACEREEQGPPRADHGVDDLELGPGPPSTDRRRPHAWLRTGRGGPRGVLVRARRGPEAQVPWACPRRDPPSVHRPDGGGFLIPSSNRGQDAFDNPAKAAYRQRHLDVLRTVPELCGEAGGRLQGSWLELMGDPLADAPRSSSPGPRPAIVTSSSASTLTPPGSTTTGSATPRPAG